MLLVQYTPARAVVNSRRNNTVRHAGGAMSLRRGGVRRADAGSTKQGCGTRGAHTPKAVYMHPQGRTPFQSPSFQRWENALGWLLIDECVGVIV